MAEGLSGGDLSRLRRLNARTVVETLKGGPPLTLTQISVRTGLSRASTDDVVRELLEQGWVTEEEPTAGQVGRPARRFRFHAEAGWVLGVDICAHRTLAVVADLDGGVRHAAMTAVDPDADRTARLAAVDVAVETCVAGAGVRGADIWASGVATVGLVDRDGRVASEALPDWKGVDLAAHVGRHIASRPVLVESDSKLAALAEHWQGAGRYADDMVYLFVGSRVGAGLVVNGRLHRGYGNAAGEVGTLPACGTNLSAAGPSWPGRRGSGAGDWLDLLGAARKGDRAALSAVRVYAQQLACGAAALILTLDPHLVVLGGPYSADADLLLTPFRQELERWCIRTPEVRLSPLGDDAVALGAVRFALDHIEEHRMDTPARPTMPSA
ncbi:ROK family transcriptional regulator [Streptomyces sp. NPDC096198]|uniref:ROK family transcriptional regulator n=1 Tax=Streptomyces sp. NPDC096198 TaxID=3366080 RepID=UPI00382FF304